VGTGNTRRIPALLVRDRPPPLIDAAADAAAHQRGPQRRVSTSEGVDMAGKSPRKSNAKKQGKTLKEKQAAKKLEKAKRRETSHIPPSGH
jgi:hypothetical protein